jgi:hypothetical protein
MTTSLTTTTAATTTTTTPQPIPYKSCVLTPSELNRRRCYTLKNLEWIVNKDFNEVNKVYSVRRHFHGNDGKKRKVYDGCGGAGSSGVNGGVASVGTGSGIGYSKTNNNKRNSNSKRNKNNNINDNDNDNDKNNNNNNNINNNNNNNNNNKNKYSVYISSLPLTLTKLSSSKTSLLLTPLSLQSYIKTMTNIHVKTDRIHLYKHRLLNTYKGDCLITLASMREVDAFVEKLNRQIWGNCVLNVTKSTYMKWCCDGGEGRDCDDDDDDVVVVDDDDAVDDDGNDDDDVNDDDKGKNDKKLDSIKVDYGKEDEEKAVAAALEGVDDFFNTLL